MSERLCGRGTSQPTSGRSLPKVVGATSSQGYLVKLNTRQPPGRTTNTLEIVFVKSCDSITVHVIDISVSVQRCQLFQRALGLRLYLLSASAYNQLSNQV